MLYITTRNNVDTFTSRIPLLSDTAQDGGYFMPHKIPCYSKEELAALKDSLFAQTVANVLNVFFSSRLSAPDIDFAIGKKTVSIANVNHRVLFAELWHNPDRQFSYLSQHLHNRLLETGNVDHATDWSKTAVIIAVMFGLYGKMLHDAQLSLDTEFDISVPADDFLFPMAAWYARRMGLPVKTIICACSEKNNIWDLFHRGSFLTNQVSSNMRLGLEKIISMTLGKQELSRYLAACDRNGVYSVSDELLLLISEGFYCSVVGKNREEAMINSIYRSNVYVTDPVTAVCYGGAQDYRASTGNSRPVVLLSQQSPLHFADLIKKSTGISDAELNAAVKR